MRARHERILGQGETEAHGTATMGEGVGDGGRRDSPRGSRAAQCPRIS